MTTTASAVRERKSWDFILTIILLVVYLGWTVLCSFAGALIAFAGDSCGASSECDYDAIATGFTLGMFGPAVLAVVVLIFAIIWLARRHISFWIPLVGAVLAAAIVAIGFMIATGGVVPTV